MVVIKPWYHCAFLSPDGLPSDSEMRGLPRPRTPAATALNIVVFVFARWRCSSVGLRFALPALVPG